VTINMETLKKRKKIQIAAKIVTNDNLIEELEKAKMEAQQERYALLWTYILGHA